MSKLFIAKKTVKYNEHIICYELIRKNVKHINLRIRTDGSITISANMSVPISIIDEFILKKADKIIVHMNKFYELKKYATFPKKYVSGESFYLLGNSVRLEVIEEENEGVYDEGSYLYLKVRNKDDFTKKENMINKFFDEKCKEYFGEISTKTLQVFVKYGVKEPKIKIRNMKTRWGSCLPHKGIITLNKRLIEAPINCIEYVVLHEYSHFIHPNHSKQFYNFVAMLMS